ncbi:MULTISPECIES: hypothetical protein [Rahnella]|uniref:hypothetical protein n=1 Tax=Rahnella TaxID=34037 RepID=UPI0039EF77FC
MQAIHNGVISHEFAFWRQCFKRSPKCQGCPVANLANLCRSQPEAGQYLRAFLRCFNHGIPRTVGVFAPDRPDLPDFIHQHRFTAGWQQHRLGKE